MDACVTADSCRFPDFCVGAFACGCVIIRRKKARDNSNFSKNLLLLSNITFMTVFCCCLYFQFNMSESLKTWLMLQNACNVSKECHAVHFNTVVLKAQTFSWQQYKSSSRENRPGNTDILKVVISKPFHTPVRAEWWRSIPATTAFSQGSSIYFFIFTFLVGKTVMSTLCRIPSASFSPQAISRKVIL